MLDETVKTCISVTVAQTNDSINSDISSANILPSYNYSVQHTTREDVNDLLGHSHSDNDNSDTNNITSEGNAYNTNKYKIISGSSNSNRTSK